MAIPIAPPSYRYIPTHPQFVQPYVIQDRIVYRRSPIRRFCHAFAASILIWFMMSLAVRISIVRWCRHGHHCNLGGTWMDDFPVPSDVTLSHCASKDQWLNERLSITSGFSHASEISFRLPLSHDTLFLSSRGPAYGALNIVSSANTTDVAMVHLTVNYLNRNVRDVGAKVCLVKRPNNAIGVGVFTRRWNGRGAAQHALFYEATVILPESGNASGPRQITNFETDVPNTSHQIGDLRGLITFLNMSLKGSNAPIHIKSIVAQRAEIRSSNGLIEGVFNTSRSLILKTSNAPILADVGITNEEGYVSELVMHTSNNKLESHTSLMSPLPVGGRYLITASTSNGPLYVDFPTSPLDSILKLQATTSNSPASVSLHPAYEGSFSLATSSFSLYVKRHEVDDPSGNRRQRIVKTKTISQRNLQGSVSWSGREGPGSVSIRTSNSPATIEL